MDSLPESALPLPPPGRGTLALAPFLAAPPRASAHLARLPGKQFLFAQSGHGFLMYAETGPYLVAMGDPVAQAAHQPELAAAFLARAAQTGRRPLFYRTTAQTLPLYRSLGLTAQKLGEQAIVPLAGNGAALNRPDRANLRRSAARAAREGCSFEIVPPNNVPALLPALAPLSAQWLAAKRTREKRFSTGHFHPAYLAHFPLALVRCHGTPVAFATLWHAGTVEIEIDLMRHGTAAPYGSMDFLFAELMRWAAAQGIAALNLGFAPLAGVGPAHIPPLSRPVFRLGTRAAARFYNFEGLRRFKNKCAPHWQPRYLVGTGLAASLPLTRAVLAIAALSAGGAAGLVRK